jgi:RNAse (barnase) inhibitor barstar
MTSLLIDWSIITDKDKFYDYVFSVMEAPSWHGRNLDALHDSWVGGDICKVGPPFNFVFKNSGPTESSFSEFIKDVEEIADASVRENGGSLWHESDRAGGQGGALKL